jgi:uncharacterized membrane protein (DUF485 family)
VPHFDSPPPPAAPPQAEAISARNARYGLALFAVYLAVYAGFVLLNAFRPAVMDITFSGVNLAIWYGLGLIVAALLLALVYAWLCRAAAKPIASQPAREERA